MYDGREESLRVRMKWLVENVSDRAEFDKLPGI